MPTRKFNQEPSPGNDDRDGRIKMNLKTSTPPAALVQDEGPRQSDATPPPRQSPPENDGRCRSVDTPEAIRLRRRILQLDGLYPNT